MDKEEKQRRNDVKRSIRKSEKEAIVSSCPIPIENLRDLFDFLDIRLTDGYCDERFTMTFEFLAKYGLEHEAFVDWSIANGGGCDCEILLNIEEAIDD